MAENSKIGWTTHTWNPHMGCHKVSAECTNCYIGGVIGRMGKEPFQGPFRTKSVWRDPFKWNRTDAPPHVPVCPKCGGPASRQFNRCPECDHGWEWERPRVFTCSLSDFFHPGADAWREEAWDVIRQCTNLDWLILTKRPELAAERLPEDWGFGWDHVWLGVTCGHPDSYWRIDALQKLPARLRFVSAEPLLAALDLSKWLQLDRCSSRGGGNAEVGTYRCGLPVGHEGNHSALMETKAQWFGNPPINWCITGCEQAAKGKRREMELEWVQDIDRQCRAAGVPHFFKQAYVDGTLDTSPLLDGSVRQELPER